MGYYAAWLRPLRQELAPTYRDEHIAYLTRLREEGKVSGNGRLLDGPGGLVIYRAASLDEAKALAATDPFVAHGVRECELYEWDVHWAPYTGLDRDDGVVSD